MFSNSSMPDMVEASLFSSEQQIASLIESIAYTIDTVRARRSKDVQGGEVDRHLPASCHTAIALQQLLC
jgi:hypothetical protein